MKLDSSDGFHYIINIGFPDLGVTSTNKVPLLLKIMANSRYSRYLDSQLPQLY
jgi:uncharacterized protein involved in high-affinity Fe2+ transport